jgi:hypothetical protein
VGRLATRELSSRYLSQNERIDTGPLFRLAAAFDELSPAI